MIIAQRKPMSFDPSPGGIINLLRNIKVHDAESGEEIANGADVFGMPDGLEEHNGDDSITLEDLLRMVKLHDSNGEEIADGSNIAGLVGNLIQTAHRDTQDAEDAEDDEDGEDDEDDEEEAEESVEESEDE